MDTETRDAIQSLTAELARTQEELQRVKRGGRRPQLGHSSIDRGAMEIRDPETQATRMRIGWVNGAAGMVTEGGDPVSAPTAPMVTPSLGGLRITWDGRLADDTDLPVDFDHMVVHVSTTSGFTPSAATYVGSIRRGGEGGMLPVVPLPYEEHYVTLVPVTTGGVAGEPSQEVAATPEHVDAPDLAANSIEAVHVQAGAIEADKLEAVLALVTTIIAGIPGAARVELDQDGLRGYNTDDELVFAIDAAGNAVFSGDITGSEILGSRMQIGAAPDAVGTIESVGTQARIRMTSAEDTRAELVATDEYAEIGVQTVAGSDLDPFMRTQATTDHVLTAYGSGSGNAVTVSALSDYVAIGMTPEESSEDSPSATQGVLYAFRTSDVPVVSLQSPQVHEGDGAGRRSLVYVRGTNGVDQDTADLSFYGNRQTFGNDVIDSVAQSDDGFMELRSTHSILSVRHRYVRTEWSGDLPTGTTTGSFVGFTESEYPSPVFKTGASGAVRIVINAYGINANTNTSLINIGFGVGTFTASRARSAEIRSVSTSDPPRQMCSVVYLDLDPDTAYILEPRWRLSSGSWGGTASLTTTGDNSIIIEPLT